MKRALIAGSFDPITVGHLDLLLRASVLFDRVYLTLFVNSGKQCRFDAADRLRWLEKVAALCGGRDGRGEIVADRYDGLLADYVRDHAIDAVVRGARSGADFDYEYNLSLINRRFDAGFETIILPARAELQCISSTMVREALRYGRTIESLVPDCVREDIERVARGQSATSHHI